MESLSWNDHTFEGVLLQQTGVVEPPFGRSLLNITNIPK